MRRLVIATAGLMLLSISGRHSGEPTADGTICPVPGSPLSEARLLAIERENGCLDAGAAAPDSWPPGWNTATIAGGDIQPARVVADPYPTLHSVVVDSERNKVFMSDPNRHALWSYDRLAASKGREAIEAQTGIRGPSTGMMFIAAVALERDELAVSVEGSRQIVIYKRDAQGRAAPLRVIRGVDTGLADPHGVFFDGQNNEIVVANHGDQNGRQVAPGDAPARQRGARVAEEQPVVGGRFDEPSITVYPGDGKGNIKPSRRIQGAKTGLNWPMAID